MPSELPPDASTACTAPRKHQHDRNLMSADGADEVRAENPTTTNHDEINKFDTTVSEDFFEVTHVAAHIVAKWLLKRQNTAQDLPFCDASFILIHVKQM
jgi:hypothetical protein